MGVKASKIRKWVGGSSGGKRLEGPGLAPRGYIPVCVGLKEDSSRRFMVHTNAFRDADFREMLRRSAEEYGFQNDGVLRIPFEARDFEEWIFSRYKRKIMRGKPI